MCSFICYSLKIDIDLRDSWIWRCALIRNIAQIFKCKHRFKVFAKICAFSDGSEATVPVELFKVLIPEISCCLDLT